MNTRERPIVAFQGETGAFSEAAAEQLVPGPVVLLPSRSFDAAVRAVVDGYADYAVIPIHNVIFGTVHEGLDAMAPFASIERLQEMKLPIRLSLLGLPGTKVSDVREVLSHPVALAQCTRFLAAHPEIVPVEAYDTAGAARMVAIRRDRTVAAIAAPWAAKHYRLEVIAEGLEDRADNATTFVLVRRKQNVPPA